MKCEINKICSFTQHENTTLSYSSKTQLNDKVKRSLAKYFFVNSVLILFSLVLLSVTIVIPSSYAWDGQMAMDSDNRNIEYGEIINYKGYLYGDNLLEKEKTRVTVFEKNSGDIVWDANIPPNLTSVEYFENTAWTFDFQIDTSEPDFRPDVTYVVKATYNDKSTELDFFINPGKIEDKATEAGSAIIIAGEKTGELIMESGAQAGEIIVEKSTEAAEKGAIVGEVVVEKSSEGIQEINDKGGGCLIATAAYGTELAPQVQLLREIRDTTVMSTLSGSAFMTGFNQAYYSFSPTIADFERENPLFQQAVRLFITPMLSTLSIMTLAENGSDSQVFGLGISVIALNLAMYIGAPAVMGLAIHKQLRPRK